MFAKANEIVKPLSVGAFQRQIIEAVILLAPIAATAQPAPKIPVVGILSTIPTASTQAAQGQQAFEQGLREIGLIPGKNLHIEYRNPEGKLEQLDALARDLVRLRVDVILARGPFAIQAAKKATTRSS